MNPYAVVFLFLHLSVFSDKKNQAVWYYQYISGHNYYPAWGGATFLFI